MGKRRGLISFGKKRNKQKNNGEDNNDDGDDGRRAKGSPPARRRRRSRSGSRGREGRRQLCRPPAWAREARDHLAVLSDKMWQQIRSEANVKFFPG